MTTITNAKIYFRGGRCSPVRVLCLALAVGIFLGLPGCGSGKVIVPGRLVKSGAPLALKMKDDVFITFFPVEDPSATAGKLANSYQTQARVDGTFVLQGQDRKGIPRGKYRVVVDLIKKKKRKGTEAADIIREVNGPDEIVIDIDNPDK